MKKMMTLALSAVATLGIGTGLILSNGVLSSKAIASNLDTQIPVESEQLEDKIFSDDEIIDSDNSGVNAVNSNLSINTEDDKIMYDEDGTVTILRTSENGETVMLKYLYENGLTATYTVTPAEGEPKVENFSGSEAENFIRKFTGMDKREMYVDAVPGEDDITEDEAIAIALEKIASKYAVKQEVMDRFTITAKFYSVYEEITKPVWWINLYPTNTEEFMEIGCYSANIDSKTGEVIRTQSAANGKG